jgi:glutathione-regulated potassium-efflux system ancillary protein KefG
MCRLLLFGLSVNGCRLWDVTPRVRTEDLVDAQTVAEILGLSHRNTVSSYLKRYPEMPRPVVDLPTSRIRLWLRAEIEAWSQLRSTDPPKLRDKAERQKTRRSQ